MKKLIAMIFGLALTAGAGTAFAAKVEVCHVDPDDGGPPRTISVSESAVPGHLGHGDTLGACSG